MKRYSWILLFALMACNTNDSKFEYDDWIAKDDLGTYPNRSKMVDDLTRHHHLKGLTVNQLIDKIGKPEENVVGDSNTIYYNIETNFGHDIDPIYSKTLEFKFNEDSIITCYKVNETKSK